MIGVFLAFDIVLFYVFFELTLVPLFFLIGIWGGAERQYAARKFFIYTLTGSLITLLGVLGVVLAVLHADRRRSTFSIPELVAAGQRSQLGRRRDAGVLAQRAVLGLPGHVGRLRRQGAADARSTPGCRWPTPRRRRPAASIWPACCSSWAATASCGCASRWRPTRPVSVGAAADHLAGGDRHRLRGVLRLRPGRRQEADRLLVGQPPGLRACWACSASTSTGLQGSLMQMINHGLSTPLLFLLIGMLYERYHTRKLADYGGMATKMPLFARLPGVRLPVERRPAGAERLRRRVPVPGRASTSTRAAVARRIAADGAGRRRAWCWGRGICSRCCRKLLFGPVQGAAPRGPRRSRTCRRASGACWCRWWRCAS